MTDKDRCGLVLPMSCRGSETFARNLHVCLKSFGIEDESWHQNGNAMDSPPISLSPQEENENPLENVNKRDGLKGENVRDKCEIIVNGTKSETMEKFLESCSSLDEVYETASDHSDEENSRFSVPKVRRCSSLKTGKTPPGTPGGKKIVRFADALGLDLADVKTFVDEIPKVPTSAFHDLRNAENSDSGEIPKSRTLILLFQQPSSRPNFQETIRNRFVSLENAVVEDPISFSIKGIVRVRNIDFHKSVFVRFSTDCWKTHVDVQAVYVENSCDGFSDRFSFLIYAHTLIPGQSLEFAVVFQARGEQFWDNNNGANYCFQCIPTQNPVLPPLTHVFSSEWDDHHWGAAFY